jgi:hypothetical protein
MVRAAITGTGEPKHPTIKKFFTEALLYKHVGMNLDDLRHRPLQEVLDYMNIVGLIAQEEARKAKKAQAEAGR